MNVMILQTIEKILTHGDRSLAPHPYIFFLHHTTNDSKSIHHILLTSNQLNTLLYHSHALE